MVTLNQDKSQSTRNLTLDLLQSQLTDDIDIEAFSMSARHLKPGTLGKVIDNLAQIYNEKTGQKIEVIFRKMIDDSKDKKYQPSPNKVEQRRQRVLSLVEDGVVRISELVKQSGVSETVVRRYLEKEGYRVSFGTASLGE